MDSTITPTHVSRFRRLGLVSSVMLLGMLAQWAFAYLSSGTASATWAMSAAFVSSIATGISFMVTFSYGNSLLRAVVMPDPDELPEEEKR